MKHLEGILPFEFKFILWKITLRWGGASKESYTSMLLTGQAEEQV